MYGLTGLVPGQKLDPKNKINLEPVGLMRSGRTPIAPPEIRPSQGHDGSWLLAAGALPRLCMDEWCVLETKNSPQERRPLSVPPVSLGRACDGVIYWSEWPLDLDHERRCNRSRAVSNTIVRLRSEISDVVAWKSAGCGLVSANLESEETVRAQGFAGPRREPRDVVYREIKMPSRMAPRCIYLPVLHISN